MRDESPNLPTAYTGWKFPGSLLRWDSAATVAYKVVGHMHPRGQGEGTPRHSH